MRTFRVLVAAVIVSAGAVIGGSTAGAVTTHLARVTATCTGSTLKVTFHLENVPAGVHYLAVVDGGAEGTKSGSTNSDQIVVNIPDTCPAACTEQLEVDLSLAGEVTEDTALNDVPISCPRPTTTTTTTTIMAIGTPISVAPAVTAAPTSTTTTAVVSGAELPRTGTSSAPLAVLGGSLLVAGVALALSRRKVI